MKKVVALICARSGSKGIPNKAMAPLFKRPLIEYSIRTALNAKIHEVHVSSDSNDILNFAQKLGCKTLRRPDKLANDTASIESVIKHFTFATEYSYIVLIQPTSPLLLPQHLDKGLSMYFDNLDKLDSVFSVYSMEKNDILFWDSDTMKPVNYDHQARGIRQERKNRYFVETGAFYITSREQFLESGCRIGKRPGFCEVPYWSSPEIDTMEDLKMVEKLIAY